ncbi:MAG: right-handed parallel beta-helix repeat-containing protein [Spirochaetes bacterium]|nr:right-handed parallel beta-helix repeat-containing protein [Spirochaetota bacterium]
MSSTRIFSIADFSPAADGVTDDLDVFIRCFTDAKIANGATITIPPGTYFLSGTSSIPIPSHAAIFAYGAVFILPEHLGDKARIDLFAGTDIVDFHWNGGCFKGQCFDHRRQPNTWEPNVTTRIFAIATSRGGRTEDIRFRDVSSERIAGAVVSVAGCHKDGSDRYIDTYAENITLESCTFIDSGKFMWDYGLLWQMIVWPEDYTADEVSMAYKYFHRGLIRDNVRMENGDTRVSFANNEDVIPVCTSDTPAQCVCFSGDKLPANIIRGRKYYVASSGPYHITISDTFGGAPIQFDGNGSGVKMIHNLQKAFYELFWPIGTGPGKGGIDIVAAKNVTVTGCRLSALGDTMHIHSCDTTVFSNNHITGSRMGAFFLAEWCRNTTIIGNTVDGTNGSRVMSVEKSNENVTIMGNIFRNGGRGSWINQPKNIIIQGNVFVNNTTKCEHDPCRGRRSFHTGDYEQYAEMYFTLHEKDGSYGPVILRDNIFVTGPECATAVSFAPNGHDIIVSGNVFTGHSRIVTIDPSCTNVTTDIVITR